MRYLMSILLALPLTAASAPRTIAIPALSFGQGRWSVLKLVNHSNSPHPLTVEVYRENGAKLPLGGPLLLQPNETREIRLEAETDKPRELCWAKVVDPAANDSAVEATATLEVLQGNTIESFSRPPAEPSRQTHWLSLSASVQGKDLYFLNASDKTVSVGFCSSSNRLVSGCDRSVRRYPVKPHQTLLIGIGRLRGRYFMTEASASGQALVTLLVPGKGERKVFSSDSSIQFQDVP